VAEDYRYFNNPKQINAARQLSCVVKAASNRTPHSHARDGDVRCILSLKRELERLPTGLGEPDGESE